MLGGVTDMSIGAYAAASGLSVPALRRYDEAGVLRPARVDERTGYRWYTADQIATGVLVGTLRQLDVPLAEVAAMLAEPDPAVQLARLEAHWTAVESSVRQSRALRDHLARLLGGWQPFLAEYAVQQRRMPEQPVLLRRRGVDLRGYHVFVREAVAVLRDRATRADFAVAGDPVSLYTWPAGDAADEHDRIVEVCLPVAGDGDAVLPAGRLVATDAGPRTGYPAVLAAYGAVAQWALEAGQPLVGPPLMVHLADDRVLAGWCLPDGPSAGTAAA